MRHQGKTKGTEAMTMSRTAAIASWLAGHLLQQTHQRRHTVLVCWLLNLAITSIAVTAACDPETVAAAASALPLYRVIVVVDDGGGQTVKGGAVTALFIVVDDPTEVSVSDDLEWNDPKTLPAGGGGGGGGVLNDDG